MVAPPKLSDVFSKDGDGEVISLVREIREDFEVLSDILEERRWGERVGHRNKLSTAAGEYAKLTAEKLKDVEANVTTLVKSGREREVGSRVHLALSTFYRWLEPLGAMEPDEHVPPDIDLHVGHDPPHAEWTPEAEKIFRGIRAKYIDLTHLVRYY